MFIVLTFKIYWQSTLCQGCQGLTNRQTCAGPQPVGRWLSTGVVNDNLFRYPFWLLTSPHVLQSVIVLDVCLRKPTAVPAAMRSSLMQWTSETSCTHFYTFASLCLDVKFNNTKCKLIQFWLLTKKYWCPYLKTIRKKNTSVFILITCYLCYNMGQSRRTPPRGLCSRD